MAGITEGTFPDSDGDDDGNDDLNRRPVRFLCTKHRRERICKIHSTLFVFSPACALQLFSCCSSRQVVLVVVVAWSVCCDCHIGARAVLVVVALQRKPATGLLA